ncbi:SirB2 family protein [uncultured Aquabacterium sp.]|uniref:SirB2 family protein n=1 Tax=uncultured Aquabacterium sp. TaxID=158753 RepID=UPI0025F925F6|nr:SirB2 family protein [uncultured Aquabacterium sp.]
MDYTTLKTLHLAAITLSALGFAARGLGIFTGAGWVRSKPARVLPLVVDTVLLASGVALAILLKLQPGQAPWLMAKLIGLVVYIGLGTVAIRPGRPMAVRAAAWVSALMVLGWMASVALSKRPAGWLAWFGL